MRNIIRGFNTKVSVIVPSKDRAWLHAGLFSVFKQQDYPNIELLVADSGSSGQSSTFTKNKASNIHYYWLENDLSVGAKRNFLIERAKGQIIVHFDDDDYYAPNYVSTMVELVKDYDFVTLSAWFNRDVNTGDFYYWDTMASSDYHFTPGLSMSVVTRAAKSAAARAESTWGYGFAYAYKRALWQQNKFLDINFAEDYKFYEAIKDTVPTLCFPDEDGLVVHSLWEHTLSSCSPQYRLPAFMLEKVSKTASDYYKTFHASPLADEFMYFSQRDSDGGDLGHVGKVSMNALLYNCMQMDGIAVNTNGWVKKSLKPQHEWTRLPLNAGGIWVKRDVAAGLGLEA